jgi:hypothetical protein
MPRRYSSRSKRKVSRRKKRVSRRKSRTKRKTRRTRRMRGGSLQAKAEALAKALAMQQDAAKSLSDLSSDPTATAVLDKVEDMEDMEEEAVEEEGIQRKFLSKLGEERMSTERDDTIAHIERTDLEAHTVPELQQMCRNMGFITTGLKKDLVARLLKVPYYNDLNKIKARHRAEQGELTLQLAQEQSQTYKDTGLLSDRDMGFESD